MRFRVDLIIRCTTWPTREKNPTPPVHLGHDFQPTTTVGSSMGHKFWPKKTQSNIENFDLILMLSECGPKNLPNVRFMLDSASRTNVEFFFWFALNPILEQLYINVSSQMLDLLAYPMALNIVPSMWGNVKGYHQNNTGRAWAFSV
jgi:hypothetical protein